MTRDGAFDHADPDGLPLLDERGRRCPLPVIALAKAGQAWPGQAVRLLADDPAAIHDVPAWCRMKGATLVETTTQDGTTAFVVQLPKQG